MCWAEHCAQFHWLVVDELVVAFEELLILCLFLTLFYHTFRHLHTPTFYPVQAPQSGTRLRKFLVPSPPGCF